MLAVFSCVLAKLSSLYPVFSSVLAKVSSLVAKISSVLVGNYVFCKLPTQIFPIKNNCTLGANYSFVILASNTPVNIFGFCKHFKGNVG